jgi:threonine synthase
MWRYAPVLPPIEGWQRVSLGEGMTPVVPLGNEVVGKVDYLNPTLSFKDRGAALLVAAAVAVGATSVVTDSSGNAGTAVAAYAARAGLAAEIWVPAATSQGKLAAMRAHGATVELVAGDRAATAAGAARRVEETGAYYASHVYQPLFAHGVKTLVLELWEQLGGRLPGTLVVPVGNGTLVSGCAHAVVDLKALGLIERGPRIVAVQAASCAPLAGLVPSGPTVAEGIAIAAPPRGAEVVAAVKASGGAVVTVDDRQIMAARADLAGRGLWVEPTAAAAWAAWQAGLAVAGEWSDTDGAMVAGEWSDERETPGAGEAGGARSGFGPVAAVVVLCGAGLKHPGPAAPIAP